MGDLIGWELIYRLSEAELGKREDVLVLATHYLLVKAGFRCIGLGDDKTLSGNETSSETLPPGWSRDDTYALRYVKDNTLYIFRGIPNSDTIVFNLLKVSELVVSSIVLCAGTTVGALRGNLSTLIPNYEETFERLRKELVEGVGQAGAAREAATQTRAPSPRPHHSQAPYGCPQPQRPASIDPIWSDPERDPLRVGGADLDPFSRGGGGMIFNPFAPHGGGIPDPGVGMPPLPRGAVPPGARFDPFGPPRGGFERGRGRPRPPPDHDHFEPPGFGGMIL